MGEYTPMYDHTDAYVIHASSQPVPVHTVPEPDTLALLALAVVIAKVVRRKK
jgi:hypothetical protein